MKKTDSPAPKPPRKQPVRRRPRALHRAKMRDDSSWFFHPEMQARIAEAEADLLNGRSYRTDSAEGLQKLLDSWKK